MELSRSHLCMRIFPLFIQLGFKNLTMDDLAKRQGISKKTLYKFFKDKKDLVGACVELGIEADKAFILDIQAAHKTAIEEMVDIARHAFSKLQNIHPSIFFDLRKYYPASWEQFSQFKQQFIGASIEENLKKGIASKHYRNNFDIEVIRDIYLGFMDFILLQEDKMEHNPSKQFKEFMRYHLLGIASPLGVEQINLLIKNDQI